jgi:hypothetical protein
MFTSAIFAEKFWRSIKAWGYHGFMPKRKSSSAQNPVQHQSNPIQTYHAELSGALGSVAHTCVVLFYQLIPLVA